MNGIRSLNAGAYANLPQQDIRLSGDHRGSYVQRRRAQMAYGGIPGADGRRAYGIGSIFQKYIKDPIEMLVTGKTPAQLEKESQARVNREDLMFGEGYENPLDTFLKGFKTGEIDEDTGEAIRENALFGIPSAIGKVFGTGDDQWGKYTIPMTIGAAAGLAQKKYLEDQPPFPGDETGIKFQTAKQVMEDEGQRFKPLEKYVEPSALAAEGGRIGYATGGKYITKKPPRDMDMNWGDADTGVYTAKERFFEKNPLAAKKFMQLDAEHEQDVAEHEGAALFDKAAMMAEELDIDFMQALQMIREGREYSAPIGAAQGGRIGYRDGTSADWIQRNRLREIEQNLPLSRRAPITKSPHTSEEGIESILQRYAIAVQKLKDRYGSDWRAKREELSDEGINMADVLYGNEYAQGGRIGAQEGGLMNLGGMEKDYRQEGGFVPIGGQEKADDVPARLSKNEFVFTADAVRAAGGGDIDAGAEVMENLMENLEAGGKVSEESQGLEGARDMFANAQALEKRII